MSIQGWFPLGLTALISLQPKGLSRVFSRTTVQKHQFFGTQPTLWSNSHIWSRLQVKPWLWVYGPLLAKVMSLFFDTLSKFTIVVFFFSKEQVSFNIVAIVTVHGGSGAQENESGHGFHCFPIYLPWREGARYDDLSFLNAEFQASFFTLLFHLCQQTLVPLHFLPL